MTGIRKTKIAFAVIPARTMHMALKPAQWTTLVCLGSLANRFGVCWPTKGAIADLTGLNEEAIKRSITWLVRAKLIRRLRTKHKHGVKTPGRYQVLNLGPDQPMPVKEEMWEPVGWQKRKHQVQQIEEGSREKMPEEREVRRVAERWVRLVEARTGALRIGVDEERHVRAAMRDGLGVDAILDLTAAWLAAHPGQAPASAAILVER
jgi:hypothetical protein